MELLRKIGKDAGILVLRVSFGLTMLLAHGLPKLQKLTSGESEVKFYDFMGLGAEVSLTLAVFAELICSGLLTIGWFTRLSLIPLIFTMAIAFFSVHGSDPFKQKEMAFLYLIAFIALFLTGAGKFSVDGLVRKKG